MTIDFSKLSAEAQALRAADKTVRQRPVQVVTPEIPNEREDEIIEPRKTKKSKNRSSGAGSGRARARVAAIQTRERLERAAVYVKPAPGDQPSRNDVGSRSTRRRFSDEHAEFLKDKFGDL